MARDHTGKLRLRCSYCSEDYYEEDGHDYTLCCERLEQYLANARKVVRHYENALFEAREQLIARTRGLMQT